MRNQRTNAIIAIFMAMLAAVLGAGALSYGTHPEAWTGPKPACNQIRSAIAWTDGRISTALPGTDAKTDLEAQRGELVKQLAEAKCDISSVPGATPTASPTTTTAPPSTCDTHFFTTDPNKVSLRAFGPAVENNGVDGVLAEYFRRNTLDTALLAENLNVLGIRQDSKAGQQQLSEDLVKDCAGRTSYVQQVRDLLAKSKVSIETPDAQTVGSAYMVDGPNGVPLLEWDNGIKRNNDYVVLQIVLPSGEKIWFRLACGFQYDKPGTAAERKSATPIRACVNGAARDSEGNCPASS